MAEEVKNEELDTGNQAYIEKLKELKENSVSREEFDAIVADNKRLFDALAEGKTLEDDKEEVKLPTLAECEKELFDGEDKSNLNYAKLSLAHRAASIRETGVDPYLPNGDKIVPTEEDVEAANRVAEALEYCIEYADGDSEVFTNELKRIMIDTAPMVRGKR